MFTPSFCTDAYKVSHGGFMIPGTNRIYANMTARSFEYLPVVAENFDGLIVVTGIQAFLIKLTKMWKKKFFNVKKKKALKRFSKVINNYLGPRAAKTEHLEALWNLGFLPIEVNALPEGSLVGVKVPFLTIHNTLDEFAWLTNYLETFMSCELWKPMTVATIARQFRLTANKHALLTVGSTEGTEYQNHDFSFRGMSGLADAAACGAAFLLSSSGTDTIPALEYLEKYYYADIENEMIAASVPASEHSLASTGIAVIGELETYRKWITQDYPTGIVSVISDTTDFFRVITEYALALKDDILARQPDALGFAKVVFRPDSGCPVKILTGYILDTREYDTPEEFYAAYDYKVVPNIEAVKVAGTYYTIHQNIDGRYGLGKELSEPEVKGAVECLWDIFGGTVTEAGYRLLHERVGLIYGDSITLERADIIPKRLAAKGFASINVVYGIGSFSLNYLTRDSAGMAVKATYAEVDGVGYALSKNPKTDSGVKKSASGLLFVSADENGHYTLLEDNVSIEKCFSDDNALELTYEEGFLFRRHTFKEVKERLWANS